MSIDRHWLDSIDNILRARTANLKSLAKIVGKNPTTFYIGTSLDGADLSGQDLRGMIFTHLDIDKIKKDEITKIDHEFTAPPPISYKQASFLSWSVVSKNSDSELFLFVGFNIIDKFKKKLGVFDTLDYFFCAKLSFYQNAFLIAIPSFEFNSTDESFFIICIHLNIVINLDWSNEPIYRANEIMELRADSDSLMTYFRFFFFFVRGALGQFQLVENATNLHWKHKPTDSQLLEVNKLLIHPRMSKKAPKNMVKFSFTCVFKNAIFISDAYLAMREIVYSWPSEGTSALTTWQFTMRNDKLLKEDLPVFIPESPKRNLKRKRLKKTSAFTGAQ